MPILYHINVNTVVDLPLWCWVSLSHSDRSRPRTRTTRQTVRVVHRWAPLNARPWWGTTVPPGRYGSWEGWRCPAELVLYVLFSEWGQFWFWLLDFESYGVVSTNLHCSQVVEPHIPQMWNVEIKRSFHRDGMKQPMTTVTPPNQISYNHNL